MTSNSHSNTLENQELALLLIRRVVGINRYFKLAMSFAAQSVSTPMFFTTPLVPDLENMTMAESVFILSETVLGRACDDFLRLIRVRIEGRYYIYNILCVTTKRRLACSLTYKFNFFSKQTRAPFFLDAFGTRNLQDASVDMMLMKKSDILWLGVDGQTGIFDPTGHYPVVAGYDSSGGAFYIGALHITFKANGYDVFDYILSKIGARASSITMSDGIPQNSFHVMVLQHNPADSPRPLCRTAVGALDPTGPLYWTKFWPEKDPELVEFEEARPTLKDSNLCLERFLNLFTEKSGSKQDLQVLFDNALEKSGLMEGDELYDIGEGWDSDGDSDIEFASPRESDEEDLDSDIGSAENVANPCNYDSASSSSSNS